MTRKPELELALRLARGFPAASTFARQRGSMAQSLYAGDAA
jgi:hypothetical protein